MFQKTSVRTSHDIGGIRPTTEGDTHATKKLQGLIHNVWTGLLAP